MRKKEGASGRAGAVSADEEGTSRGRVVAEVSGYYAIIRGDGREGLGPLSSVVSVLKSKTALVTVKRVDC